MFEFVVLPCMDFEAYLVSKKIDSAAFRQHEPERWQEFKTLFEQVHPNSFTQQKLYLINPIRRKYILKEIPAEASASEAPKAAVKPVMKPRPKFK
ncbi:MAG TPA: hypothetical protein PKC24_14355 [Cyclobacteriaceae bacterium]|nr:hypothetical protein [Cyclobacteriaceae bacterium]